MLKRKLYESLLNWKDKYKGTTALLIDGARRIGKSYICEEFGKNESLTIALGSYQNLINIISDNISFFND